MTRPHYHDFSRFAFFGLPFTPWECSCGIKTWRGRNVEILRRLQGLGQ